MKQIARFIIVGVVNTGLGYGIIFFCMYALMLNPILSNAIGYGVGFLISFTLNKNFTFESNGRSVTELGKFLFAFIVAYLLNLAALYLCLNTFELHGIPSQLIAGVIYIASSFLLSKHLVFVDQKLD
jgi:putative flippase GtrA